MSSDLVPGAFHSDVVFYSSAVLGVCDILHELVLPNDYASSAQELYQPSLVGQQNCGGLGARQRLS